jgi:LuxR family transcriptional regulator, maltose regulon positive regulatory protein
VTEALEEHPVTVGGHLTDVLLHNKLAPPPVTRNMVSRRAVIEAARSSGCRAVGITAPAGYGKSTLLVEWARMEDRPLAWLSLDRFDDDPTRFLIGLASAYALVDSTTHGLVDEISHPGVSVLGRAAPRLAATFASAARPFVLMVDDLHEVQSDDCLDVLELVMARFPPGSQLVSASRSEQPHLSRLRHMGDTREIGMDELALDEGGARAIFHEAQVELTPERAGDVTKRTEGWAVGIQLAALITKDAEDEGYFVTGDDRYVADYLYQEILARQPEHLQRFLRRTSVLEQMSGPLCDAVLESHDADQTLRELERANLFVLPLDRRRRWYRYHGLFREFLLSELRRREAGEIDTLHRRAADWYEAQESPEMALEHLLQTGDQGRAMRLLLALSQPTYQRGGLSTWVRWLSAISDASIRSYPPLAVHAGWYAVLTGDTVGAEGWAALADSASYSGETNDGSASFESATAMLRAGMCSLGPDTMLSDAEFAAAQEPASSIWRPVPLHLQGQAHLLVGDGGDAARPFFVEAARMALEPGRDVDSGVMSASELAILAMDQGGWHEASNHLDRALTTIEQCRMQDYATSLLAFAGAARLALHRGQRDTAMAWLTRAMRNRHLATYVWPVIAIRLRIQLAKAYLALSDMAAARQLARECEEVLIHRPALGTLNDDLGELRDLLRASETDTTRLSVLTPAEFRLLPYLQTHLTLADIGKRLSVSRNTVNSQISSIYRKLGVSSRQEAVEDAIAKGLLGD